jgi:hypothetical protein
VPRTLHIAGGVLCAVMHVLLCMYCVLLCMVYCVLLCMYCVLLCMISVLIRSSKAVHELFDCQPTNHDAWGVDEIRTNKVLHE